MSVAGAVVGVSGNDAKRVGEEGEQEEKQGNHIRLYKKDQGMSKR